MHGGGAQPGRGTCVCACFCRTLLNFNPPSCTRQLQPVFLHPVLGQITSRRLSAPSSTSTLAPAPTRHPQLLHVPGAGPARAWQGCFGAGSALRWASAGNAADPPRPPPRHTPTGSLLKGETQRAGLPAGVTALRRAPLLARAR